MIAHHLLSFQSHSRYFSFNQLHEMIQLEECEKRLSRHINELTSLTW